MTRKGKVVVFGGAGFIGSHLVGEMIDAGYQVRAFDKLHGNWSNLDHFGEAVERHEGDFQNRVDLGQSLEGCDVAVHLVSATLPSMSNDNPIYDMEANVVASLRLLEEAKAKGVRRILFISSGGTIYGRARTLPIPEDHPTEPLCSYGIGKLAIEKFLALYHHLHGLEYHVLRFSNPFGERQNPHVPQGAVAVFFDRIRRGQPIEIWGAGDVVRDYIHISDAVGAFRRVLERNPEDRVLNVGSGVGTSLNGLVEAMTRVTGRTIDVVRKPGRAVDVPANVLNIERIRAAVGWTPLVPLEAGLERTWSWLQATPPAGPGDLG